jgi:hypothetical protein
MITFGRYSDAFKAQDKIDWWNKCEKEFQQKDYLNSYESFFNYLKDESVDNLTYKREGDTINFEFLQGSKIVHGYINPQKVCAEADIAEYEKLSVAFMRRLMELNYSLFYSRFAMKDNRIVILSDSAVAAAPPRKLYYAWKELATRADKQDDLLIDDFAMLKSMGNTSVEQLSENEKEVKYAYFKKWLDETLKLVSELNEDAFSGANSYLLLNCAYKIDYLIAPEGTLMNDLEKMSWDYFARDNKPFPEKNRNMKKALEKIAAKPKEEILGDLYRTKSTFGIANPAPHATIVDLVKNNINNVKWYIDNNYPNIAVTIYEYLATYSLFSYGLPKPDARLFHVMINVINQDYFTALGTGDMFIDPSGKFNQQLVIGKINEIILEGQKQYPELKFNTDNLKFDTLLNFLRSFITEMQNLNFNV